jgi:D-alanyl-D-alanine carboxypeptidase
MTIVRDVKEHFERIQSETLSPDVGYGVVVAGATVAKHNADLPFRIASMSKSFVAAAVLMLRDSGALTLDAPVASHIPDLAWPSLSPTDEVTVRQLLTMTSGLANDDPWADRQLDMTEAGLKSVLNSGGYFALRPNQGYVYSNLGYVLLGQVIRNVAGCDFQRYISERIFEPLGMTASTWDIPDTFASPHRLLDGAVIAEAEPPLRDGTFAAMGGVWSTVDDLMKWTAFLADGTSDSESNDAILTRASRREMQRVHAYAAEIVKLDNAMCTIHGGYGMGLRVYDIPRIGWVVDHTGGLPGYGSNMMWCADRSVHIVSLANITYAPVKQANLSLLEKLQSERLTPDPIGFECTELQSQANSLVSLLNNWDDDLADNMFSPNVALDESYESRRLRVSSATRGASASACRCHCSQCSSGSSRCTSGRG